MYNERRGALASADAQLSPRRGARFPDVAYRFDAAGEPREIPTLTADALRDYHERYYTRATRACESPPPRDGPVRTP